jgi:hypothetical protein
MECHPKAGSLAHETQPERSAGFAQFVFQCCMNAGIWRSGQVSSDHGDVNADPQFSIFLTHLPEPTAKGMGPAQVRAAICEKKTGRDTPREVEDVQQSVSATDQHTDDDERKAIKLARLVHNKPDCNGYRLPKDCHSRCANSGSEECLRTCWDRASGW